MQIFAVGDIVEDIRERNGHRGLVRSIQTDFEIKRQRSSDSFLGTIAAFFKSDKPGYWINIRWACGIETTVKADDIVFIGNVRSTQ